MAIQGKKITARSLTIKQATGQARRHVDRIMLGVGATVESKLSHDLASDTPTIITVVTFPAGDLRRVTLGMALRSLSGATARVESSRITVTRTR